MLSWLYSVLNFETVLFKTTVFSSNISITLKASFTSNCFVILILFMYLITTIYSIGYLNFERDNAKIRFHLFTFISVIICIGLAYSDNLFTAFIFYDLLSVFTYMLVKHHRDEKSENSAFIYAMYLIVPSMLFLLPGIICVYSIVEHVNFIKGGVFSGLPISQFYINILFLMFVFGISKVALYPLHKWLIYAMVAPSPVSALLHAVLVVKGGLFLMYKVIYEIFGLSLLRENIYQIYGIYWPVYIAIFSIILAGISAISSENIKKRLAYSTISQIGYISMCLFYFTEEGIYGAKMQFLAHSFAKISLFYYAGYLLARYHCVNIGELKYARNHLNIVLSLLWLVPCLSLMSTPLTVGYFSKHAIMEGTIHGSNDMIFFITIFVGMILCIFYLYPIVYHLITFNIKNKRFQSQQYFSTFCIYASATIISFVIVLIYFLLLK